MFLLIKLFALLFKRIFLCARREQKVVYQSAHLSTCNRTTFFWRPKIPLPRSLRILWSSHLNSLSDSLSNNFFKKPFEIVLSSAGQTSLIAEWHRYKSWLLDVASEGFKGNQNGNQNEKWNPKQATSQSIQFNVHARCSTKIRWVFALIGIVGSAYVQLWQHMALDDFLFEQFWGLKKRWTAVTGNHTE